MNIHLNLHTSRRLFMGKQLTTEEIKAKLVIKSVRNVRAFGNKEVGRLWKRR